ncbi:hypothetical protein R3P38DRAFT_3281627 [Favolaschia claudopus]|uniref:F-box domain-containing protein n=1 Tax=Favolaschia claudopus TaxID=2862362 RepID=A0AAW0AG28_9AGAR
MDFATMMRVLRSNDPPSPDDIAQIRLFHQRLLACSSLVAESPLELPDVDVALSYDKYFEFLEQFLSLINGLSSPLRRFPPELLSHIFMLCREDCWHRICDEDSHTLITLGKVCSRWRTISREMPQLWTKMHFSTWALRPCNAAGTRHLLDLSRDLPLSLHISTVVAMDDSSSQGSDDNGEEVPNLVSESSPANLNQPLVFPDRYTHEVMRELFNDKPSIDAIRSVAARLESLCMDFTSDDFFFNDFLECHNPEFPILSSLSITVFGSDCFCFEDLLTVFHAAPNIKELWIDYDDDEPPYAPFGPRSYAIGWPDFPWNRLRKLTIIVEIFADEARTILCQCEALEIAAFSELIDDAEDVATRLGQRKVFPEICTLSDLRELSISSSARHVCDILECMSLPSLQSLTIETRRCNFLPVLVDLRKNSKFALLHLNLRGLDTTSTDPIYPLLAEVPTLETLVVECCPCKTELHGSLTYTPSPSKPLLRLPHLRILAVDAWETRDSTVCPDSFVKLLDSLSHYAGGSATPCPNLKTLRALFPFQHSKPIEQQLAPVCADGFDLRVC